MNPVLASCQIGDPLPVGNRLDQRDDKQRGLVAENVRTQQPFRFGVSVELAESTVVLHGPPIRGVAVVVNGFYEALTLEVLRSGTDQAICGSLKIAEGTHSCGSGRRSSGWPRLWTIVLASAFATCLSSNGELQSPSAQTPGAARPKIVDLDVPIIAEGHPSRHLG